MSSGLLARVGRAVGRFSGGGPAGAGESGRDALRRVRVAATRVALVSTAIVAGAYLVIAVVVVLIVTGRETSEIDTQLTSAVSHSATDAVAGNLTPDRTAGSPLQYWVIASDGTQFVSYPQDPNYTLTTSSSSELPSTAAEAGASPQTVSIDGEDFRVVVSAIPPVTREVPIAYDPVSGDPIYAPYTLVQIAIGESLNGVGSAEGNLILAEAIVGPILLLAVFLGALTIGRRVAAPIEEARVRQMEFTADASHELRTPLSVIEAQTSLALAQPRDVAWYHAAFQRVEGESGRMRRLVEDLLWLARFDTTRDRTQAEHVDLAVLTHMAADRFTAVAEARGVRLTVRTPPVPLAIHAPPDWLDRLLGV
ncbi:MAG: histidine kinase dimerization/phospho-acceptor domain-containing protein, partial [Candidatus Dormibacteria bacterium]